MRKYWHVLVIGIQNNLTYRFNFLARSLFGLIPLIALILLWQRIYSDKGTSSTIGAYTLSQMISYYLLTTIVDALTAVNEDDWQIAADIKDGNISQLLLKPLDYLTYRLWLFFSGRVTYLMIAGLPLLLFILCLRRYFVWPPDAAAWALFFVSVFLTALLQFFISYAMAMLAFWVLEVSSFIFILFAFEYIASGHMFPLDILPGPLQRALQFTPFYYQLYFPVAVYLGKTQGAQLWDGLMVQACWVAIAYAWARFAWWRGVRRYSAVGA